MGAFFLYDPKDNGDLSAVLKIFNKKGFAEPDVFDLSNGMRLISYRKQLIDDPNHYQDGSGNRLFLYGTCVYKGLGYRDTKERLLKDHCSHGIDQEGLIGNYCIFIEEPHGVFCLIDPLYVYSVFTEKDESRFSNSFLAMLGYSKNRRKLNRMALYEKLSTGYIVGPDTLIEGMIRINKGHTGNSKCICFITNKQTDDYAYDICDRKGFTESVEYQINILKSYVAGIRNLAAEYKADLGLSGGYDSRLVLALAADGKLPLKTHTHFQVGMHDDEGDVSIAHQLSNLANVEMTAEKTRPVFDIPDDEIEKILYDGLYYFDGRNSHNMGAFSQTYTRMYKITSLGDRRLSLNGLGGEIYRNYYYSPQKRYKTKPWMDLHIYYPNAWFALRNSDIENGVHEMVVSKIGKSIGSDISDRISLEQIRRYYSEVRMPECDGINHNAHNQLAFYLTPFIEKNIVKAAYEALPHIGLTGRFEANLIKSVNPQLAAVQSRYGFCFSAIPLQHNLYGLIKGYTPTRFWVNRNRYRIQHKNLGVGYYNEYINWVNNCKTGQKIQTAFMDFCPDYLIEYATRDNAQRGTVVFLGSFFREFSSCLTG